MCLAAAAKWTQTEVLASGEVALDALERGGADEIGAAAKAVEAERALAAATVWTAHHVDLALAEGPGDED